jgi:hypothetical protein
MRGRTTTLIMGRGRFYLAAVDLDTLRVYRVLEVSQDDIAALYGADAGLRAHVRRVVNPEPLEVFTGRVEAVKRESISSAVRGFARVIAQHGWFVICTYDLNPRLLSRKVLGNAREFIVRYYQLSPT